MLPRYPRPRLAIPIAGLLLLASAPAQDWAEYRPDHPGTGPTARRHARLVGGIREAYLFGGESGSGWHADLFRWRSDGFAPGCVVGAKPPARAAHAMAFDSARRHLFVFGGRGGPATLLGDTWELDLSRCTWSRIATTPSPAPREFSACAYDPQHLRVVLFGGADGQGRPLGDTWTHDPRNGWQPLAVAGPPPLAGAAMVADPAHDRLVLFGGATTGGATLAATWAFSGGAWQQLLPAVAPPARRDAMFARDRDRAGAVLFGGRDGAGGALADTWIWDGTGWRAATVAHAPPPSAGGAFGSRVDGTEGVVLRRAERAETWTFGATGVARRGLYGSSCGGSLRAASPGPRLGRELVLSTRGSSSMHVLVLGFGRRRVPLGPWGMPECFAHLDPITTLPPALPSGGVARHRLAIPALGSLSGLEFHAQGVLASPGTNALGFVVTPGWRGRIAGPAPARSFYGNPMHFASLANTPLNPGAPARVDACSNRLRVPRTGRIVAVRKPFIFRKPGYAAGDLGACVIEVWSDDGIAGQHFPARRLGGTRAFWPGRAGRNGSFPRLELERPVDVHAGALLHLVFRNVDPAPAANHASVNDVIDAVPAAGGSCTPSSPARPPHLDPWDLGVLVKTGGAWSATASRRDHFTAVIDVRYEDGGGFGNGYVETGSTAAGSGSNGMRDIDGTAAVREVFAVSGGDRATGGLWFRVLHTGGTGALTATLTRNGSTLASAAVAGTAIPIGGRGLTGCSDASNADWVFFPLAPTVLRDGQDHELTFTTTPGTSYRVPVSRDGHAAGRGFGADTVFADGHAEFTLDGSSWRDWDTWGAAAPLPDQDLQFYFVLP